MLGSRYTNQTVHIGSSYSSASDLALTFGQGKDVYATAVAIEIEWPSGARPELTSVDADERLVIQEP